MTLGSSCEAMAEFVGSFHVRHSLKWVLLVAGSPASSLEAGHSRHPKLEPGETTDMNILESSNIPSDGLS
jgi:hypothetical protein